MQLADIKHTYFVGIGGIGMSALARYFHSRGAVVRGYDRTETPLTRELVREGIEVHYEAHPEGITEAIDLAVYTPAVPARFAELEQLRRLRIPLKKRSEVLGIISRGMKTVAVAGTHGKTTTTTLLTHMLHEAGEPASAFLGGIARNFSGNYVAGTTNWVVVEADEYDRSFLQLNPNIAIVLSMDPDHLDIYGDHDSMMRTGYQAFVSRIEPEGLLLLHHDLKGQVHVARQVLTFGIDAGDFSARRIRVEDGYFVFDLETPDGPVSGFRLPLPGRHNVLNTTAALAAALMMGADPDLLREGLPRFRGIARRFEFILREPELVLIDDYAHHPTELDAAIGAARELFPNQRITGIFQPHLYSRTRDFAEGFAQALDQLDEVILLDIYPAREDPIPGVTSRIIFEQMHHPRKRLLSNEECMEAVGGIESGVVLVMGAGDIDRMVQPIRARLLEAKTQNHG